MKKLSKTKIILFGVIAVIVIVFTGFGVKNYLDRPQDLGPNLEYLGKRHTGCPLPLPLGYLLMCSTGPGEEYYFGTDMSEEELKGYFKQGSYISEDPPIRGFGAKYNFEYMTFGTQTDNFTLFFYDNKDGILQTYRLNKTNKKNIISINKKDYHIAKNSLQ